MSIEYLPVGIACNLQCGYCYQDPMRNAGNINVPRDWERAKVQLMREGSDFALFGGEPLLAPIEHIEEVLKFGLEQFGRNGIQTNGSLITDEHIALFKRYRTYVGISVDGPGELNDARKMGSETGVATARTENAIAKLCDAGLPPSLIVTLHDWNAGTPHTLHRMTSWMQKLQKMGIKHINLHTLEKEACHNGLEMTQAKTIDAFVHFYEFSKVSKLDIMPFNDIAKLLTEQNPHVSCVWNNCDPLTTAAVRGVGPDGTQSNCGRTNKDGINWVKADTPGNERFLVLQQVPQKFGGCKDCRYLNLCKGQCPGTAIDGDWRNRTADCELWYHLFTIIEKDLGSRVRRFTPVFQDATHDASSHGDAQHGDSHGDSHGDVPHGDGHGDSDERGIPVVWRD
jgi:uncharacterized protein